jgi:membrane protein required for beta-lactamase induction
MAFTINTSPRHLAHLALLVAISSALALMLIRFLEFGVLTAFGVAVTAVCQANSSIAAHTELTQRALDVADEKARRAAEKKEALQAGVSAKKRR